MVTIVTNQPREAKVLPRAFTNVLANRWVCLALGAMFSFMSVGTRWDIALAAWAAPVFLLRFVRTSHPVVGIAAAWLVAVGSALVLWLLLAAPINVGTLTLIFGLGTAFAPPYILDRLAGPRLGTVGRLLLFPAAWAGCEFLLGSFSPMGASYGPRALTQTGNLPLLQVLSVTGIYGIGFLISWFATTVNWVWENPTAWQRGRWVVGSFVAAMALILIGGAARLVLNTPEQSYVLMAGVTPSRSVIRDAGAMVGPSAFLTRDSYAAASSEKLRSGYDAVLSDLLASTVRAARAGAKIVVWSEGSARQSQADKPAMLAKVAEVAKREGVYIVVAGGTPFASNETNLIGPDGRSHWYYQKTNPVPGMEFVPPGKTPVPVADTPFGRLSNVICFDANFPAITRVKADIMMVPAQDWPEAGYPHTMKWANLRSIENGYSFFRTDYDGQSGAFNYLGHVLATQDTTVGDGHIMYADVPMRGVTTVYNTIGDIFAWLSVISAVALTALALRGRQHG